VTAALGTKWAHCVNTRLVLEGSAPSASGAGSDGHRAGSHGRVVKVVKSPRCALVGFEYEVWAVQLLNSVEFVYPQLEGAWLGDSTLGPIK
jgi:hypothetical protein